MLVNHTGERVMQNTPYVGILKREGTLLLIENGKLSQKIAYSFSLGEKYKEELEAYTIISLTSWRTPTLKYSDDNWD